MPRISKPPPKFAYLQDYLCRMLLDDIFLYDGDRCIDAQDVRRLARFGMSQTEEKLFAYHVNECQKCRQFVVAWLARKAASNGAPKSPA